jgi:hypothetical protein
MKYYILILSFLLKHLKSFCQSGLLVSNSIRNDTSTVFADLKKTIPVNENYLLRDKNITIRNQYFHGIRSSMRTVHNGDAVVRYDQLARR